MKITTAKCVRSDNQIFVIGSSDWKITKMDGVDYPNINVYADKNATGDGALISGKRVADRDITVVSLSRNPSLNEVNRRKVIAFFNPKYTYKVYITYQGNEYWIDAELEGFKCPATNVYRNMEMTVKFYCANPYFKSVDNFGKDIASISPKCGFPFIQTSTISMNPSVFNFSKMVDISNDGDVDTFCQAVIQFTDAVTNPKIVKDSSYVRVIDTFASGDVLIMDFDKCTIKKNGVNIMQKVDRLSSFTDMVLEIGDNQIGFDADNGDNNMSVTIYYNKLYMGV